VRFSMANTIVSSGPSGDLLHQEMVWIPGGSFRTGSDKHSTGYVMLAERPLR
jgi:formylglycine-generating enzyme required for sulfatase activity